MDIWLIIDGVKAGPFPDYEIRRKIASRELGPDQPAWHEGLEKWAKLGDLPAYADTFSHLFEEPEEKPELMGPPRPEVVRLPPPIPGSLGIIRRFFARWFDLYLISTLWWGCAVLAGMDLVVMLENRYLWVCQYLPWLFIEAALIHLFGVTPGKWLLGLRVEKENGERLQVGTSFSRALRVWVLGVGMGLPIVSLMSQAISLLFMNKLGRPIWDLALGTVVRVSRIHPLRVGAFVFLFTLLFQLYGQIVSVPMWKIMEKNRSQMQPEVWDYLQRFKPAGVEETK